MIRTLRRNRGTVLLTVILMVAVAALIATDIAYRQKMDVLRTAAFLSRDSAFQFLIAAENLGLYALKRDQKDDEREFSQNPNEEIRDDLSEDWSKGAAFPLPNGIGTIQGNLYDLQGRFNVNSLQAEQQNRQTYQDAFLKLLNNLQAQNLDMFPQDVTPAMLQQRLIDWLDSDSEPMGHDGKEDYDYLKLPRPYRAANHFITDISELQLIEGFTPKIIHILEDHVSFLPPNAKINLYTAKAELLTAFGLDTVKVGEFVDKQRPQKHKDPAKVSYSTKADLLTFLKAPQTGSDTGTPPGSPPVIDPLTGQPVPGGPAGPGVNNIDDLFDIKSEYYLLKGKAVVNGKPVLIESVIWRPMLNPAGQQPGSNPPPAANTNDNKPTKVILRKLVDPLKQV